MKQNRIRAFKLFNKFKTHNILYQFLLRYFIVLFIPLLICSIYYVHMISVINDDDIHAREVELTHAAVLIDTMLDEFSYLGDNIAANTSVNSFKNISDAFSYPNSYKVYELRTMLPDLYKISQSIFDYYIFFDKSELVVNKHMTYTYESFYNLYLHKETDKNYDEWYRRMKTDKVSYGLSPIESYIYQNDTTLKLISYSRPLMYGDNNSNSEIRILFKDTVLETLMPALVDNSIQYIEDFHNRVIYFQTENSHEGMHSVEVSRAVNAAITKGKNSERQIVHLNQEKYLIIRNSSEKYGLTYYMLQPVVVVNSRGMYSIIMLIVCILIAIVVGIVLSLHMSLKSATPINDILKEVSLKMERVEGHQSAFSSLKTTFNHLINTNSDMARLIENQKPFIRNAFFNRLIYGTFKTEKEALKIADYIGLPHKDRVYGIVIIRFYTEVENIVEDDLKLINSCIISLIEVIKKILPNSLYTNIDDDQVVLMMSIEERRRDYYREETEQKIREIKEAMPTNVSEKFFVYGGNEVDSFSDLKDSYNIATYMFQNEKGQIENTVIWYVDVIANIPSYPPQDFSAKLIHYVMTGDKEGLYGALESVIKTYIIQNNLPVYLQHMLLTELQTGLFRIIRRIGVDEAEYRMYYDKLEKNYNTTLLSQFCTTLNLYRSVCNYVYDKKQIHNSKSLTSSIACYIDMNYGDSNLSLNSVADKFQISEPYLSSIFKQSLGIKFSTYMEGVRIDKAKELLKISTLSVGEIAERVGYSSTNSFCRAFKRVTGINPSHYRKE